MNDENRDFKGVWIPKEIWLNKNISAMEKLFLAEINSLDGVFGCFASNAHFQDFFGISKNRASEIIKSLEAKKLVEIEYRREGKQIVGRVIRVVEKSLGVVEKSTHPTRKTGIPYSENRRGYSKNWEGSYTLENSNIDIQEENSKENLLYSSIEQKKNLKEDKIQKEFIVSQAKREPDIEKILSHLNKKTGSNYQTRNQTVKKLIEKHIKSGYEVEDFLTVIEKKCLEWGKDEKMKKYIRPVTLFGSKFEQYLEEPWADGRINEKYDPEKHIKFPRWDALPPDVQYRWNDEEYYTSGRTEYVQGKGKKIFWTDDYDDLVRWEEDRREQSRRYHAEVERKQREYIANGGSEYDDEYPL